MQSFFNRMQLVQRPWWSSGEGSRHLIFLLRQCPAEKSTGIQEAQCRSTWESMGRLTTSDTCSVVAKLVAPLVAVWRQRTRVSTRWTTKMGSRRRPPNISWTFPFRSFPFLKSRFSSCWDLEAVHLVWRFHELLLARIGRLRW